MQRKSSKVGRPSRSADYENPEDIPLNLSELQFVSHYCSGDTASEAMRKIGSDAKDLAKAGHKMLSRPNIRRAISQHEREFIIQSSVDKSEVILMFRQAFQAAMAKGDIKAANEAAKFLGQACPDMFHAPQKKETEDEKSKKAKDITSLETIDIFSNGDEDYDINSDVNRFMSVTKASSLGLDDFED